MRRTYIPDVFRTSWSFDSNQADENFNYEGRNWSGYGVEKKKDALHCFVHDYRIETMWRNPEKMLMYCLDASVVCSPDFSVFPSDTDFIVELQLYRAYQVAGYLQYNGVNVVPTVNWVSPEQIEKNEKYYRKSSVIAVRSPGKKYVNEWIAGAEKIKKIMKPALVLHFGTKSCIDIWDKSKNLKLRAKLKK